MTIITIEITETEKNEGTRVMEALSNYFGYSDTILLNDIPIPNPQTKEQFALQQLAQWVSHILADFEINQAGTTIRMQESAKVQAAEDTAKMNAEQIQITAQIG